MKKNMMAIIPLTGNRQPARFFAASTATSGTTKNSRVERN